MNTVKCSSEFRNDADEQLTVGSLTSWLSRLPDGALLSPISIDKGNQRDPWPVLVGLRATWEEDR